MSRHGMPTLWNVKQATAHHLGVLTCSFQPEEFTFSPAVNVGDEILGQMCQGQVPSRQSELIRSCAEWQCMMYLVLSCFLQAVWPSVPFQDVWKNGVVLWCAVTLLSKSSCGLWSKTGKRRQLVYRRGLMLKQPLFLWFFSIHSCFHREYSPIKWGYTWWNGENKDREHLGRSINNCRWKQKTTNTCFFLQVKHAESRKHINISQWSGCLAMDYPFFS